MKRPNETTVSLTDASPYHIAGLAGEESERVIPLQIFNAKVFAKFVDFQ